MQITKAFRFRLLPKPRQEALFEQMCGASRYVWNYLLAHCQAEWSAFLTALEEADRRSIPLTNKRYKGEPRGPDAERRPAAYAAYVKKLDEYLEMLAADPAPTKLPTPSVNAKYLYKVICVHRDTDAPWLKQYHSHCLNSPAQNLSKAYDMWWRALKAGRDGGAPKFKSKHRPGARARKLGWRQDRRPSFTLQANSKWLSCRRIRIPGARGGEVVGKVNTWPQDPLRDIPDGAVFSVTVSKEAGRWYASVAVKDIEIDEPVFAGEVLGLDLGIKSVATLSDGTQIDPPRPLEKALKRIAFLQRRLQRRERGSARYEKAKLALAREHQRVANIRSDFLHKLSLELVKRCSVIFVEGFDAKALVEHAVPRQLTGKRKRKRRRDILDMGWGELRRQLQYKGKWYGCDVIVVDPFESTDRPCHVCGAENQMPADTSNYICTACGLTTSRQLNTARLLAAYGRPPGEVAAAE